MKSAWILMQFAMVAGLGTPTDMSHHDRVPASGAIDDETVAIADYRALRTVDRRVERVVFHLTVSNAPLCRAVAQRIGATLIDLRQFSAIRRPLVRRALDLDGEIAFETVDSEGPAGKAGLRDGDGVVAINGVTIDRLLAGTTFPDVTADRVRKVQSAIDQASGLAVEIAYIRNGVRGIAHVISQPGCASAILVLPSPRKDASADGDSIMITTGLVRLTATDDDLAVVVAHELAHNILGHRAKLDKAGVDRGIGRMFGKSRRLIRSAEEEADRVSLYLLANAGYDIERAPAFWLGPAKDLDGGLLSDGTHPCPKCRARILTDEIVRLKLLPRAAILYPPQLAAAQL